MPWNMTLNVQSLRLRSDEWSCSILSRLEASISTQILSPDPTTFEAMESIALTWFWEGVGDAHIRHSFTATETPCMD